MRRWYHFRRRELKGGGRTLKSGTVDVWIWRWKGREMICIRVMVRWQQLEHNNWGDRWAGWARCPVDWYSSNWGNHTKNRKHTKKKHERPTVEMGANQCVLREVSTNPTCARKHMDQIHRSDEHTQLQLDAVNHTKNKAHKKETRETYGAVDVWIWRWKGR